MQQQSIDAKYNGILKRIVQLEDKLGCRQEGELIGRWTLIEARTERLEKMFGLECAAIQSQLGPLKQKNIAQNGQNYSINKKVNNGNQGTKDKITYLYNSNVSDIEKRLTNELISKGVKNFRFVHCPKDYYDKDLEYRKQILGAPSIYHLCKSLVMENTKAHPDVKDCSNPKNSKYYLVICQYGGFPNWEKVHKFLHKINEGAYSKKYFNIRLAENGISDELSGYTHNSVTPVCFKSPIPIIISEKIVKLKPPFFFMGGGEVNLKLGVDVKEFLEAYHPFVVDFEKEGVAET
eukprot:TRINITY_DN6855_c1_g1_i1.p1 TRINITY_DN6855_c1_g1~~TRINITY_DN6855_c1_g1_i1.p1  ORF type:complete len:292 (-),score=40.94 TRINITY_DN6855_c1_g1_i1:149-1024(-)